MYSLYKWDGFGTVINSKDDEVEVDIDIGYVERGGDFRGPNKRSFQVFFFRPALALLSWMG